jgi:hypothetical protein
VSRPRGDPASPAGGENPAITPAARAVETTLLPDSLRTYRRDRLRQDVVARLIVRSVVTPQAGPIAAPGALIGCATLGTSRTMVVSATTATSALSLKGPADERLEGAGVGAAIGPERVLPTVPRRSRRARPRPVEAG